MKKKGLILFVLLSVLGIFFAPSVLAVGIKGCGSLIGYDVVIDVKIANAVHTIIVAIKVVVPVLLVIFGMLDLFKGITAQKEDEIKKGQQIFIKRLISAAIIFFVVSIVQLLVSFVASDEEGLMTCANCFINGAEKDGTCK
jgi:hypothetical protein